MNLVWNIPIFVLLLAVGLFFVISPEKAVLFGDTTKTRTIVMRVAGVVILTLLVVATVVFAIGYSRGEITI